MLLTCFLRVTYRGAIRHGVARALLQADADYRPTLKKAGYLTRDPRMKDWYNLNNCEYLLSTPEGKHFVYRNYYDSYWSLFDIDIFHYVAFFWDDFMYNSILVHEAYKHFVLA